MGPDISYIHCTDSTDEELDWIAETGGKASVAPYVEMLMGHGRAPDRAAARTRRPRLAQHRRRLERPRRDVHADAHGARPRPHPRVHRHAGHRLRADAHAPRRARSSRRSTAPGRCALEDKIGSLTPGKQADIVLLKTDAINTAPVLDPHRDDRHLRRHLERRLRLRRRDVPSSGTASWSASIFGR